MYSRISTGCLHSCGSFGKWSVYIHLYDGIVVADDSLHVSIFDAITKI